MNNQENVQERSMRLDPIDLVTPGFVAGAVGCFAATGCNGKSFALLEVISAPVNKN